VPAHLEPWQPVSVPEFCVFRELKNKNAGTEAGCYGRACVDVSSAISIIK
jgi:hypothetical protein